MIFLVALLIAAAVALLVYSLAVVFSRSQARVERQLAGYEATTAPDRPQATHSDVLAAETRLVQGAVDVTSGIAERLGIMARVDAMVTRADVPLRPAEVVFWVPIFALLALGIFGLLLGLFGGIIAALFVAVLPFAWLSYKGNQRMQVFEEQLPETLQLLAGGMRAGFSFMQSLEAVAEETRDPIQREFKKVYQEARLGRAAEDSLEEVAVRMESQDLHWAVMAIRIQREVGGNLAELLDIVADTMVQRERLRREAKALTAEGRLSGIVLAIVPPAMLLMLWLLQPEFIEVLFDRTLGIIALIGVAVLDVVGYFWIRRITDIEV